MNDVRNSLDSVQMGSAGGAVVNFNSEETFCNPGSTLNAKKINSNLLSKEEKSNLKSMIQERIAKMKSGEYKKGILNCKNTAYAEKLISNCDKLNIKTSELAEYLSGCITSQDLDKIQDQVFDLNNYIFGKHVKLGYIKNYKIYQSDAQGNFSITISVAEEGSDKCAELVSPLCDLVDVCPCSVLDDLSNIVGRPCLFQTILTGRRTFKVL